MSSTTVHVVEPDQPSAPAVAHPGAWRVTWHGVRTVARLELRQRVRSTKWIVALVVWFVVVGGITLLATGALSRVVGGGATDDYRGPFLFAIVTYLVLGLGLIVTPTLTSTAINGDRNAGTLATLQVTLLSPAEIVVGKLAAAWLSAIAFLLASVPFFLVALGLGGTPVRSLFAVLALVAVILAAVCGMGIGLSAFTARAAGSTVATFAAVTGLAVISPILFGITFASIQDTAEVRVWSSVSQSRGPNGPEDCEWDTVTRGVFHTERTWWLVAINPFVIVADGSAVPDVRNSMSDSPFAALRQSVREARWGADQPVNECWGWDSGGRFDPPEGFPDPSTSPIWPWGLGFTVLLGAAGVWTAVRRLSVPQRTLPKGTRVA